MSKYKCLLANSKCTKVNFWHLGNYHGLTGIVCSHHYELVSHDAYGQPNHKHAFKRIIYKLKGKQS